MEDKGARQGLEDQSIKKTLQNLQTMVEVLVREREDKMRRRAAHDEKGKKKGIYCDLDREPPSSPSSPSSPSPPSSPSSTHSKSSNIFKGGHNPQIKLDVKFDLPKYCGELNAEKLDDWIQQVEVYYRVQNLIDDVDRI